jgi:thiopurine S-methyltransferase
LQPEFWHERWRMGQIGFHQSAVERCLQHHWSDLGLENDGRVFVPLCGKSRDLLWLIDHGHSVAGVELSPVALESLCMENGIPARRRSVRGFDLYVAPMLNLFCGDFFSLTRELLGPVAAVYDRAALISWMPQMRQAYVEHLASLTSTGTEILLITMEYPQATMAGPPFSTSADDVRQLYAKDYDIRELARDDILASEPRLRSRGVTQLYEVCYRLTRRLSDGE